MATITPTKTAKVTSKIEAALDPVLTFDITDIVPDSELDTFAKGSRMTVEGAARAQRGDAMRNELRLKWLTRLLGKASDAPVPDAAHVGELYTYLMDKVPARSVKGLPDTATTTKKRDGSRNLVEQLANPFVRIGALLLRDESEGTNTRLLAIRKVLRHQDVSYSGKDEDTSLLARVTLLHTEDKYSKESGVSNVSVGTGSKARSVSRAQAKKMVAETEAARQNHESREKVSKPVDKAWDKEYLSQYRQSIGILDGRANKEVDQALATLKKHGVNTDFVDEAAKAE